MDHVCTAMKTVPQILEDDAVRSSSEARPERCGPHESGSTKNAPPGTKKKENEEEEKRCSTAAEESINTESDTYSLYHCAA